MSGKDDDLWIDTALAVQRGEPNSDVFVVYVERLAERLTEALAGGTSGSLVHTMMALRDELRRHTTVLRQIYPKADSDD